MILSGSLKRLFHSNLCIMFSMISSCEKPRAPPPSIPDVRDGEFINKRKSYQNWQARGCFLTTFPRVSYFSSPREIRMMVKDPKSRALANLQRVDLSQVYLVQTRAGIDALRFFASTSSLQWNARLGITRLRLRLERGKMTSKAGGFTLISPERHVTQWRDLLNTAKFIHKAIVVFQACYNNIVLQRWYAKVGQNRYQMSLRLAFDSFLLAGSYLLLTNPSGHNWRQRDLIRHNTTPMQQPTKYTFRFSRRI